MVLKGEKGKYSWNWKSLHKPTKIMGLKKNIYF